MRIVLVTMLIAAVGAATAVAGTTRAKVMVMSTAPVTIRGMSFHSRERVTVSVISSSSRTKVVRANAHGVFTAKFTDFSIAHCVAYTIKAKGNHGSFVSLTVTPECPPPAPSYSS